MYSSLHIIVPHPTLLLVVIHLLSLRYHSQTFQSYMIPPFPTLFLGLNTAVESMAFLEKQVGVQFGKKSVVTCNQPRFIMIPSGSHHRVAFMTSRAMQSYKDNHGPRFLHTLQVMTKRLVSPGQVLVCNCRQEQGTQIMSRLSVSRLISKDEFCSTTILLF